jgi:hypothetical protein
MRELQRAGRKPAKVTEVPRVSRPAAAEGSPAADSFDNLSAAAAVRAVRSAQLPRAFAARANVLTRAGRSACGLVAGIGPRVAAGRRANRVAGPISIFDHLASPIASYSTNVRGALALRKICKQDLR